MSILEGLGSTYAINHPETIPSPSLLVFKEIARSNIEKMIEVAGAPDRLRPHVKTHKMPELVRIGVELGITKHKCATIAEAEMLASAGASDVLIAYQPVGPNIERVTKLVELHGGSTRFRTVVDDLEIAQQLSEAATNRGITLPVLLDLNVGMGRTGIELGDQALMLYQDLVATEGLEADGLHVYDGHHKQIDPVDRRAAVDTTIEQIRGFRETLIRQGFPVPRVVVGGTPNFPMYAAQSLEGLECSPGTSVLHDHGYGSKFPDLPFRPAALLLGRVISRPTPRSICLDIGSKAVAADPAGDRLRLVGLEDLTLGSMSEEHLVVETNEAAALKPGTVCLAIPTHICPTCALHRDVYVIDNGEVVERWKVVARDRVLTV